MILAAVIPGLGGCPYDECAAFDGTTVWGFEVRFAEAIPILPDETLRITLYRLSETPFAYCESHEDRGMFFYRATTTIGLEP